MDTITLPVTACPAKNTPDALSNTMENRSTAIEYLFGAYYKTCSFEKAIFISQYVRKSISNACVK